MPHDNKKGNKRRQPLLKELSLAGNDCVASAPGKVTMHTLIAILTTVPQKVNEKGGYVNGEDKESQTEVRLAERSANQTD